MNCPNLSMAAALTNSYSQRLLFRTLYSHKGDNVHVFSLYGNDTELFDNYENKESQRSNLPYMDKKEHNHYLMGVGDSPIMY